MKSHVKSMVSMLLSLIVLLAVPVCAFETQDDERAMPKDPKSYISSAPVSETVNNVSVGGVIPRFVGLPDEALSDKLNQMVKDAYTEAFERVSDDVRSIMFSYAITSGNGYMSVVMICNKYSGLDNRSAYTFTIDMTDGSVANMADVLGPNASKVINKLIAQDARRNPSNYNSTISAITNDHNFYIEDGVLNVLFDEYEISPKRAELLAFKVELDKFVNCYVGKDDYFSATNYNIRMIMARQIADSFGYELIWAVESKTISFMRNEKLAAYISIGVNSYAAGTSARKKLETYPLLRDGRTYVPITFCEEILNLVYSIDAEGNICFSEYMK